MKTATRIKLKLLAIITVAWQVMGFVITVYDYLVLQTDISLGPGPEYSFELALFRNMGAGLIGAILGGSVLVFYVNEKYREKPYGFSILVVCATFILVVAIVTLVMGSILVPLQTGRPMSDPISQGAFLRFITDAYPLKNAMAWAFIVGITQLLLQVSNKFGHRTFWNIIKGKYNSPKTEKRIFMFLDLDDSTTIAERLGNQAYHRLLKDFFADITEPIIENRGSIYQYVGDEVVIAWEYGEGLQEEHCLQCFFDIKSAISRKQEKYRKQYGLVPSFKAGVHSGEVVAGEIGIVKRDITYSGDVLNTAARILGMCAELKQEILISSELLALFNKGKQVHSKLLGSVRLKGKETEILIHSLVR